VYVRVCVFVWREGPRGGRAVRWQDTRGVGSRVESCMLSVLSAKDRARAGMQGKGK
jgi:hypothetical protein